MGRVLSFTPRAVPASRPLPSLAAPAAVIIFSGVRYEYLQDARRVAAKPDRSQASLGEKRPPRH